VQDPVRVLGSDVDVHHVPAEQLMEGTFALFNTHDERCGKSVERLIGL